jgi:hypothetical protein
LSNDGHFFARSDPYLSADGMKPLPTLRIPDVPAIICDAAHKKEPHQGLPKAALQGAHTKSSIMTT